MTPQEIFDTALNGILEQGAPAISHHTERCLYHTPEGHRCALGQLVPVETAKEWAENGYGGVYDVFSNSALPSHLEEHLPLLASLQRAHDRASMSSDFIAQFKSTMREIAQNQGLTFNLIA